ncbi:MAG: hypothetical protein JW951_05590 [Lentisphaerae bacterium]|nr:hypothetical protein [Lentisphaerota bacterium]
MLLGATNYDIGLLATIAFLVRLMRLPGLLLMRAVRVRRAVVVMTADAPLFGRRSERDFNGVRRKYAPRPGG